MTNNFRDSSCHVEIASVCLKRMKSVLSEFIYRIQLGRRCIWEKYIYIYIYRERERVGKEDEERDR